MRFIFKNDQQQVVVTDNNASVPTDGRFIWYDTSIKIFSHIILI